MTKIIVALLGVIVSLAAYTWRLMVKGSSEVKKVEDQLCNQKYLHNEQCRTCEKLIAIQEADTAHLMETFHSIEVKNIK